MTEAERGTLARLLAQSEHGTDAMVAKLNEYRARAEAAEARIAAALKEHTPFGPVGTACPTCRSGVKYDGLGRCPTRAALAEPVGDRNLESERANPSSAEPVGEPPRPTPEETAAMDALVEESERLGLYRENYLTWDALRSDVERLNRAALSGEPPDPESETP